MSVMNFSKRPVQTSPVEKSLDQSSLQPPRLADGCTRSFDGGVCGIEDAGDAALFLSGANNTLTSQIHLY